MPGMIVAGLLAYGGTLVALRIQTVHHRQPIYPAARATTRFPTVAAPRDLARFTPRPAFDDMDIAAGD